MVWWLWIVIGIVVGLAFSFLLMCLSMGSVIDTLTGKRRNR